MCSPARRLDWIHLENISSDTQKKRDTQAHTTHTDMHAGAEYLIMLPVLGCHFDHQAVHVTEDQTADAPGY